MAILPDVLAPNLKVIFCGTAAGNTSAQVGAYYANSGNQFWSVLRTVGLTPRCLSPTEYPKLLDYGIGLTDLEQSQHGTDDQIDFSGADVTRSRAKMVALAPRTLGFNGKTAARIFFAKRTGEFPSVADRYGRTTKGLQLPPEVAATAGFNEIAIFVLPSTSGAARAYWDESYWAELADYVGRWSDTNNN
jgi:TDG/mug DNA glycosylase family protein